MSEILNEADGGVSSLTESLAASACVGGGGQEEEKKKKKKMEKKELSKEERAAQAAARAEATRARKAAMAQKAAGGKRANAVRKEVTAAVEVGAEVDMGSLASSANAKGVGEGPSDRFFLTTAINYTNGNPHIGHAYEAITSDVISRYHRIYGRNVFFQTGTDEHGQKIANTAERDGLMPIDICNKYAGAFQALNRKLLISNDFYLRTTMPKHHLVAQELWKKCAAKGDIYLGKYEGWYDEREETFVSDKDAELADFKDTYGTPLKRMSEESYFFRMSNYQDWLVQHIERQPDFIMPAEKKRDILGRLVEPLPDLSISRTSFQWGIPVPEGFDKKHVMYVWFDALSNYLTGVGALSPDNPLNAFWPASVHVIGKDIIWFHCVIWPCMLKSADVSLPRHVFAHGFIAGADGRKMSKSLGNVVCPEELLQSYTPDTLRWYMCRETPFGNDLAFSLVSLTNMHNAELCDNLGNLVNRALNLCEKYFGAVMPEPLPGSNYLPFDLSALRSEVESHMASFALDVAFGSVMAATSKVNKFINDEAPWLLKGDEHAATRAEVVRITVDALYAIAHFLCPVIPVAATHLLSACGVPPITIKGLRNDFTNIPPGTKVGTGLVLYKKLPLPVTADAAEAEPPAPSTNSKDESQKKKKAPSKGGSEETQVDDQDEFTKMDIRVGKLAKVWEHPEAERLFCEEIECGEDEPRLVASGLREHYSLGDMEGRLVCVVCNLKAAKLAGFTSNGMVLAAKDETTGKVELVDPPEGCSIGERLFVEGFSGEPASVSQVNKKKLWQALAPSLRVDSMGVACFKGKAIQTREGPCTVKTMRNAQIS